LQDIRNENQADYRAAQRMGQVILHLAVKCSKYAANQKWEQTSLE
jgi:hypothetical protein